MRNVTKRILSAIFLILLLTLVLFGGQWPTFFLIGIVALLTSDELIVNFLSKKRDHFYYMTQFLFFLFFIFIFIINNSFLNGFIISLSVFINFFLLVFLFTEHYDLSFQPFLKKIGNGVALLIFLPVTSIATLIHYSNWREIFIFLLLVNFMMDSGAWLVGITMGKTPLWPKISPKKTREGALGGVLITALFSLIYIYYFGNLNQWPLILVVSILMAIISQIGDLAQSKIKRIFTLKDSSSLIPGHGGVYDRVDSLIFLGPFFTLLLLFFNFF